MPRYRTETDLREFDSLVKARKHAMELVRGTRYICSIDQYSQKHGNMWYQIGWVEYPFPGKPAQYEQNHMGMPRPNGVRDGSWVLNPDGSIKCTTSQYIRRTKWGQ